MRNREVFIRQDALLLQLHAKRFRAASKICGGKLLLSNSAFMDMPEQNGSVYQKGLSVAERISKALQKFYVLPKRPPFHECLLADWSLADPLSVPPLTTEIADL